MTFLISFFQDKKNDGIIFVNVSEITQLKIRILAKLSQLIPTELFMKTQLDEKEAKKTFLMTILKDHLPLDISNTTEKTYGKLQVTLLVSVQIQFYMDKHICSVRFGNDAQYTLLVVKG